MTRLQRLLCTTALLLFTIATVCTAETAVSGNLTTATWTPEGSPYVLSGTVRVLSGETLTIEPGVQVQSGQLTVNGRLIAEGTREDSIVFVSARLYFQNAQASQLAYLVVQNTYASDIEESGVFVTNSMVSFRNCVIRNHTVFFKVSDGLACGGALTVLSESTVYMDSCQIRNNKLLRMNIQDHWMDKTGQGGAIYARSSSVVIANSVISDNTSGSDGGVIDGPEISLINCRITRNTMRGYMHLGKASVVRVKSCENCTIAENCLYSPGNTSSDSCIPACVVIAEDLADCIVWGNVQPVGWTDTYDIAWGSYFPTVNDTCDVRYSDIEDSVGTVLPGEGNICTDPLFTNPDSDDYSLQDSSPCINSGDPATPADLDGTVADMGASANRPAMEPVLFIAPNLQAGRMPALLEVYNPSRMAVTIDSIQVEETFHVRTTLPFTLQPGTTEYISFDYKGSSDTTVSAVIHWTDTEARSSVVILHGTRTNTVTGTITSTTWTKAASPYVVIGQCIVPAGEELTIEPGVTVSFNANVPFLVQGRVRAEGSKAEKIRFQRGETDWAGIRISGGDSSSFSYIVITGGQGQADADRYYEPYGGGVNITGTGTRVSFDHCAIRGNNVSYCRIFSRESSYFGNGGGLNVDGDVHVWLSDCLVAENHADRNGSAICASNGAQIIVDRCLFYGNTTYNINDYMLIFHYLYSTITLTNNCSAVIRNSTITDNNDVFPAAIRVKNSSLIVENSIIWDAGDIGYDSTGIVSVRYSNVESHTAGEFNYPIKPTPGIDGVGNISLDPLFADTANADYRLLTASPCIDAGDPLLKDPDGSRSDMGVMWFGRDDAMDTENRPLTFTLSQNMPNPFNPATTIPYSVATAGPVSLNIYNLQGQLVKTLVHETAAPGEYHAMWNGRDMAGRAVASGVYVYRLSAPDGVRTKRMLLVR